MNDPAETMWLIEPRDPLIVRDGRPFGPNPGARATTLPFPFPSTIAGALRHKAGLSDDGAFDRSQIEAVLQLTVRGPLLAQLQDDPDPARTDQIADWLLPAPADALLLRGDSGEPDLRRYWLAPRSVVGGAVTPMPDGLLLVAPAQYDRRKPLDDERRPRFWSWKRAFSCWLANPQDDTCSSGELGITSLEINTRVHVAVQDDTQTALEGALFQTSGLELTWRNREDEAKGIFTAQRLALAAAMQGGTPNFPGGFAPLGGERRLMRWSRLSTIHLPDWPEDLRGRIVTERRCRVILLTPACFSAGYRPPVQWERGGVAGTLVAAAVSRAQVISGWDMAHRNPNGRYGRPRPTRRLAPAGSIYYVRFSEDADVGAWIDATWMQPVSDAEQDRRDGFGLAAIGAWPETPFTQEVTS